MTPTSVGVLGNLDNPFEHLRRPQGKTTNFITSFTDKVHSLLGCSSSTNRIQTQARALSRQPRPAPTARSGLTGNLLAKVPKSAHTIVAPLVRSIFEQPDADSVWAQHGRIVEQLSGRFDAAADLLADAAHDILAFTTFPKTHWRQNWSNNPPERLNKEIRRRTDVVGIFPNRAAVIRLVGAVLAEQHDEWQVARRYMSQGSLTTARTITTNDKENQPALPDVA
jgi:hypothetical protein